MIFSILQRTSPLSIVIFLIAILGLWTTYLIDPQIVMQYYDINPMPLYKPFLSIYLDNNYIGMLIFLAIMGLNIFILTRINSSFRLIEKRSSFFVLLFILFTSLFSEFQQFNPMQFAFLWVLLGISSVFKLYKNEYELRSVFEAGFFFSIAGLFYANAFFLSAIIFIGMISLIPFYWRQWIVAICGLLTPIVFVVSWAFIFDKLPYLLSIVTENSIVWHSKLHIDILKLGFIGFISLLLVAALLYTYSGVIKKVAIQKYYFLLFVFSIIIVATYLFIPSVGIDAFFFISLPLIFFISNYLLSMKIWVVPEFLSTLIIAYIILLQVL